MPEVNRRRPRAWRCKRRSAVQLRAFFLSLSIDRWRSIVDISTAALATSKNREANEMAHVARNEKLVVGI